MQYSLACFEENKFSCSDLILDFVWACISTAERVEPHDAEGKMSWQHVTQSVNRGCSVLQAVVMVINKIWNVLQESMT